jgi:hypothetical protein
VWDDDRPTDRPTFFLLLTRWVGLGWLSCARRLYGVITVQTVRYFQIFKKDSRSTKILVSSQLSIEARRPYALCMIGVPRPVPSHPLFFFFPFVADADLVVGREPGSVPLVRPPIDPTFPRF